MLATASQILFSKAGAIIAFALLMIALERVRPAVQPLATTGLKSLTAMLRRIARNISLAGLNAALSPLIVIPISAVSADHALNWRPEWWAGWPGLTLDVLILDFWIYWWHRANHEIPLLWRFHEVHHLDEFLDVTSAVRFHAGEVLLSALVRSAVIFLLAMPLASIVVFEVAIMFAAIFHHSNLYLPPRLERSLSWFVVTPSIHWVHHHAIRRDTDSNYSTVLSVWDHLFGSRSPTARSEGMTIGVERAHDKPLSELLVRPFRWRGR